MKDFFLKNKLDLPVRYLAYFSGDPLETSHGGSPGGFCRDIIAGPHGMTRSRQYTIDGPNCMNFIPNYHTYFGALYFDLLPYQNLLTWVPLA